MLQRFFSFFGLKCLLLFSFGVQAAQGDCREYLERAGVEARAGNYAALQKIYEQSLQCSPAQIDKIGLITAQVGFNSVIGKIRGVSDVGVHQDELRHLLTYSMLWQVHEMLGDYEAQTQRHELATVHFQSALTAINDTNYTPEPPPRDIIYSLFKKAESQRLLASRYVPNVSTRSGEPGGLGLLNIRGVGVNKTAIPIQFEFGTDKFTTEGLMAAEGLFTMLSASNKKSITLVGHTDPVGDEVSNFNLSVKRAESVSRFLKAKGFQGKIEVKGLGETEPFQPDTEFSYTTEQLHKMSRRVELVNK